MKNNILKHIASFASAAPSFPANQVILVRIKNGECPETVGENLRSWCRAIAVSQWRQTGRGAQNQLKFEFENLNDAYYFSAISRLTVFRQYSYFNLILS